MKNAARVRNATRKNVISESAEICSSASSKALGLMFSAGKKSIIMEFSSEQKVPLHMVFVFFPIDVLFLDRKRKVVEIKRNFRPFSFYSPSRKAMYVIEVPAGKAAKTKIGDSIRF